MNAENRPRIALWFRYGPAEHTELFHAMPDIIEALDQRCEVHYFGLQSRKPVPERIRNHAVIHSLPFRVDRASNRDKFLKTALWLLALPWIGRQCRKLDIRAVYIDETIPLSALLARTFFGPKVAMTVADFFVDIYFSGQPLLRPLARWIRRIDLATWRRLPLIFTRARHTREYLAGEGIPAGRIFPVYDPCDMTVYHPVDRKSARMRFGFADDEIILVHHGILHPNKGNDRILQALADARQEHPRLRYLLIGDGPDMPRLRDLADRLNLGGIVRFTGWLATREEVNTALNASDIGLVMRIGQESDNFHTTGALVHNMAAGLPILAARLGGVSEIALEDRNGLLFDPSDMAEFRIKLDRLIRDPTLRERLGKAAHADALEYFDMRRVTESTVNPLLGLL